MMQNTKTQYGTIAKLFHWGGAILIIGLFMAAYIMMDMAPSDQKWAIYGLHKSFGLLALCWVTVRFAWRTTQTQPESTAPSRLFHWLAEAAHALLYILMFLMPLSGYVMSSASGYEVHFFGLQVPNIIGQNPELGKMAHSVHEYASFALMGLVGVHVLAALWHHFILKDSTLKRMIKS